MAVAKVPVVDTRVFALSSRRDGVFVAWPECNLVAGEVVVIWIDPTSVTGGQWLASVDNAAVEDEVAVGINEIDTTRELVAIDLDLTLAEGGERVTLGCDIHPDSEQTLKAALVINITAPALPLGGS